MYSPPFPETLEPQCYPSTPITSHVRIYTVIIFCFLSLDKQAGTRHLLRLRQTHGRQDRRRHITQDTFITLLEAPALRRVGHDERHLVGGVAGLGLSVGELHLLGVSVVGRDEQDVALLLARLVDLADGLVGGLDTDEGCLVHTRVADHVWWGKVVHHEGVLVLTQALGDLLGHTSSGHLGCLVVGGHRLVGRNEILGLVALLEVESLLHTTVEEECDVGVLLGLSDVDLLNALLAEPLGQDIAHVLRSICDIEGVSTLVLCHGDKSVELGVDEVGCGRSVDVSKQLGDLSHTVRSVVEEEHNIVICYKLAGEYDCMA